MTATTLRRDADGSPVTAEWEEGDPVPAKNGHKATARPRKASPRRPARRRITDDEILAMAGVEKRFSTGEVAAMFGKSTQWLYWGLKEENGWPFRHADGRLVDPERVGGGEHGNRRFTADECRAIATSSYKRGNLPEKELAAVLRRILVAERGQSAFRRPARKKAAVAKKPVRRKTTVAKKPAARRKTPQRKKS